MASEDNKETIKIGRFDMEKSKIKNLIESEKSLDWRLDFLRDNDGAEMFLVGGAVRDSLLGRQTKDFDFVIRGVLPEKMEKWFMKRGSIQLVGKSFGVYKFIPAGETDEIDIALPRTEHVSEGSLGGYRDFDVQSDPSLPIESDLARRDFTINAMAYDIKTGEVIDPYSGLSDLNEKSVRAVGNPSERFNEDLSRMLRGIRIAVELNFKIEESTWNSIIEFMPRISATRVVEGHEENIVAKESIGREFLKMLYADSVRAIELLESSGALEQILPEYKTMVDCKQPEQFHTEGDVWEHTKIALAELYTPEMLREFPNGRPSVQLILSVLLHDIGKPSTQKTPERDGTERIRFDGHTDAGAKMSAEIIERLRLFQYPKNHKLHIDREDVFWLIKNHLITMNDIREMRPSVFEKYFMGRLGNDLIALTRVDCGATIWADGSKPMKSIEDVLKRREELRPIVEQRERERGAKQLLSGDDLIAKGLSPSPDFRRILSMIRDAELEGKIKTKEEALELLEQLL